jgi:hypothetical protein
MHYNVHKEHKECLVGREQETEEQTRTLQDLIQQKVVDLIERGFWLEFLEELPEVDRCQLADEQVAWPSLLYFVRLTVAELSEFVEYQIARQRYRVAQQEQQERAALVQPI